MSPPAPHLRHVLDPPEAPEAAGNLTDVYFSADVETDGPIPGPYSLLSFALVYAGRFGSDGFQPAPNLDTHRYVELKPISDRYEAEALAVNGLDRERLAREGKDPVVAMTETSQWVRELAGADRPILVAYPLSFDWVWLYWYFVRFSKTGSPFNHSGCFDIKTAYAVKAGLPISGAGRSRLDERLRPDGPHEHHALHDAIDQAEVFVKLMTWADNADGPRAAKAEKVG